MRKVVVLHVPMLLLLVGEGADEDAGSIVRGGGQAGEVHDAADVRCGAVRCDANSVDCSALRESGDRRRGGQERFEQMDLMTFEIMRT